MAKKKNPILWFTFRPLLSAMVEARDVLALRAQKERDQINEALSEYGVEKLDTRGFKYVRATIIDQVSEMITSTTLLAQPPSEVGLRASSEYILELTHCLIFRPQGVEGRKRVAKLDALLAQVDEAIGSLRLF